MIPLSLFSSVVSTTEKERIAEKILLCKPFEPVIGPFTRFGAGFGKPDFPI